jgi:hypothetical protein
MELVEVKHQTDHHQEEADKTRSNSKERRVIGECKDAHPNRANSAHAFGNAIKHVAPPAWVEGNGGEYNRAPNSDQKTPEWMHA